jgi:hypothetical protein
MINTIFASHLIDSKGRAEPGDMPVPNQTTEIQTVSHGEEFALGFAHPAHSLLP